MNDKIFTVSELTLTIKSLLEPKLASVAIQGEISNFKQQSSGHIYFSLKDLEAQISCAFFRGDARNLTRMPKDGDQVIVKGSISIYPPRGSYQVIVKELEFSGIGALLAKLHELKEKLKAKGWFDPALKKRLPQVPKRIGVVTSPTGAVIQDILNILKRRFPGFHLILNPVKVQGEGAKEEIARAIYDFNKYELADVLIVGRGGGSLEDLWPFNEEIVAKAIFESKIPIISAVGHETDFSIADFVADVRAPTPSAAAELVIVEKAKIKEALQNFHKAMAKALQHRIENGKIRLLGFLKQPLFSSPSFLFAKEMQKLDEIKLFLSSRLLNELEKKKMLLLSIKKRLTILSPLSKIENLKQKLKGLSAHLRSISPLNLLEKGYTIVFSEKERSVILSAKDLKVGQAISTRFRDGVVTSTVKEIDGKDI